MNIIPLFQLLVKRLLKFKKKDLFLHELEYNIFNFTDFLHFIYYLYSVILTKKLVYILKTNFFKCILLLKEKSSIFILLLLFCFRICIKFSKNSFFICFNIVFICPSLSNYIIKSSTIKFRI